LDARALRFRVPATAGLVPGDKTLGTTTGFSRAARVLVAEDDEDGREALATALRQIGAEVDAVADGGRLLVAIASHYRDGNLSPGPDLIVTDVLMPVCSGMAIFEALRAAHWTTPVIMISARDTPAVRTSAAAFGATFMLKPVDLIAFQRTALRLMSASGHV
jgi:DNA-binding response OmpR family regulator